MLFWVGGYGADLPAMGGRSEGIGTLTAGAMDAAWASGTLSFGRLATARPSPSPSWLAAHPSLDVVFDQELGSAFNEFGFLFGGDIAFFGYFDVNKGHS